MIEEYKLEEQLAPFYETASASASSASVRCFLPPSSSAAPSSSSSGVKPALRTVSIMETLSELTNAREGAAPANRRRPVGPEEPAPVKASKAGLAAATAAAAAIQRRKKIGDNSHGGMAAMASNFLDIPQWYPAKRNAPSMRPVESVASASSERVWDVSRFGGSTKLGMTSATSANHQNTNNNNNNNKARSVQDILTSPANHIPSSMAVSSNTHGYGSLERRRRRRPGTRAGFAMSARRGETDWEREEDEEEEDADHIGLHSSASATVRTLRQSESIYPMQSVPASSSSVFQHQQQRNRKANSVQESDRNPANYKSPAEWFKKKRPQPPQSVKSVEVNKVERGQTPDWIHKIFHVARRGHLMKLVSRILKYF